MFLLPAEMLRLKYGVLLVIVVAEARHGGANQDSEKYSCTDMPPNVLYTCAQQKKWGKCNESWMSAPAPFFPQGYCQYSCGNCAQGCYPPPPFGCHCTDIPPTSDASCTRQAELGNCDQVWMHTPSPLAPYGNCQASCGRCPAGCAWPTHQACPCGDIQPPHVTCSQLVAAGSCEQAWVSQPSEGAPEGYCRASCQRCPCDDEPPPNTISTCGDQAAQGKCGASWMLKSSESFPNGFCQLSCGRCHLGAFCQKYASNLDYEKLLDG